jgi:hypothetical protein
MRTLRGPEVVLCSLYPVRKVVHMSGYCNCKCRDCFEIAIADDENGAFCWECEEAGCDEDADCKVERFFCPECSQELGDAGDVCDDCGES